MVMKTLPAVLSGEGADRHRTGKAVCASQESDVNEMSRKYRAFGMVIESEFPIAQVPVLEGEETPDVVIRAADLSGYAIPEDVFAVTPDSVMFQIEAIGNFRVTNGDLVEVDVKKETTDDYLAIFLMGSCMGAILHQRGLVPIHGSCVTNGHRSVIITGDSGAGKSTLASEFLHHGWKLLTDDVSVLKNLEGVPEVQSSYPSQKLWKDTLDQYSEEKKDIHSLYARGDSNKFGVSVENVFFSGTAPLSLIVRLLPAEFETTLEPMNGFAKVDQLMRNTYRSYMIAEENRQRHFQRCVNLSQKIPMALVVREIGVPCADKLYELITNYLEELA